MDAFASHSSLENTGAMFMPHLEKYMDFGGDSISSDMPPEQQTHDGSTLADDDMFLSVRFPCQATDRIPGFVSSVISN